MNRRQFLHISSGVVAAAAVSDIPVIDTHIHLFDTSRPQGVPWPSPDSEIYRPALPQRFRQVTATLGVRGAIEVECSPWLEDNQWVLDVAARDTIILGTIGNLNPGTPDFPQQLERFHRNPLFRGIRYGNLWGRSLAKELPARGFVDGLKLLAEADLVLDTANPNPELIEAVLRLTDKVSNLRVVIDHLPHGEPPADPAARSTYNRHLRELAGRPQVYVKISEVLRRIDGRVPLDLETYRPRLDELWGLFGEDRLLFGSDWPNSDPFAPYSTILGLAREYLGGKSQEAAEKFFWKNSKAAYRWSER